MNHNIEICPGFDSSSLGRHLPGERRRRHRGATVVFTVTGDDGVLQLSLFTNWAPRTKNPSPITGYVGFSDGGINAVGCLEVHHPCETHEDYPVYPDPVLDGRNGVVITYGLLAHEAVYTLCNGGTEELWKFMDGLYSMFFHAGAKPVPYEYPLPQRHWNDPVRHESAELDLPNTVLELATRDVIIQSSLANSRQAGHTPVQALEQMVRLLSEQLADAQKQLLDVALRQPPPKFSVQTKEGPTTQWPE